MLQILKFDGHWLIAEIEEIPKFQSEDGQFTPEDPSQYGQPDCLLKYPCEINGDGIIPFPPYSEERELVVRSENITIVAEPAPMYSALYYDLKAKDE